MEDAITTIQKRNLALATNVLAALKEARTTSPAERPAWTVILGEAALLASRDFDLPDTRDVLALTDEAKEFAWRLYYSFLTSLTEGYKLHTDLAVPLHDVSVGDVGIYLSMLERHRADLEKYTLVECVKRESVAAIFCNGRPLRVVYADSIGTLRLDESAQNELHVVYEFKPKQAVVPKNLRKGPAVRGSKGKIRNW